MRRITITIDGELYKAMAKLGEANRSRFIASAISSYLAEASPPEGRVFALVVFDGDVGEVDKEITSIQQEYRDVIGVSTHIHLTEDLCAEVIHIAGEVMEIANRLSRIERGIKYFKVLMMLPSARGLRRRAGLKPSEDLPQIGRQAFLGYWY